MNKLVTSMNSHYGDEELTTAIKLRRWPTPQNYTFLYYINLVPPQTDASDF